MTTPVSTYRLCTGIRWLEPDSSLNKKGHEEECRMTYECGTMAYLDVKIGNVQSATVRAVSMYINVSIFWHVELSA